MAARIALALAFAPIFAAGCSVTPLDTSAPNPPADLNNQNGTNDPGKCTYEMNHGCFDGHLSSTTQLTIDGKQFFNADDLSNQFHALLDVNSVGKTLAPGDGGYTLTMLTPLDNANFYQGFQYTVQGADPRSGQVDSDGTFSIDDLTVGTYSLRISKPVRFQLTAQVAPQPLPPPSPVATPTPAPNPTPNPTPSPAPSPTPSPAPSPTPAPTPNTGGSGAAPTTQPGGDQAQPQIVTKEFCATLYADSTITVNRDARSWAPFGTFQLHVTNDPCPSDGSSPQLSLNP